MAGGSFAGTEGVYCRGAEGAERGGRISPVRCGRWGGGFSLDEIGGAAIPSIGDGAFFRVFGERGGCGNDVSDMLDPG